MTLSFVRSFVVSVLLTTTLKWKIFSFYNKIFFIVNWSFCFFELIYPTHWIGLFHFGYCFYILLLGFSNWRFFKMNSILKLMFCTHALHIDIRVQFFIRLLACAIFKLIILIHLHYLILGQIRIVVLCLSKDVHFRR